MTHKPHHTTTKRRHSSADNHALHRRQLAELERELGRELAALYDQQPKREVTQREKYAERQKFKPYVRWSVRCPQGGLPFVFKYEGTAGCWQSVLEADAKKAIIHEGLAPYVHLETVMEE